MRVAVVQHDAAADGARQSFGAMLARPAACLASDLTGFGHDVTVVTLRLGGPRRIGGRALSLEARDRLRQEEARTADGVGISTVECTSPSDLSRVLRAIAPDAVLAVGRTVADLLDRPSSYAGPWAFAPLPGDLRVDGSCGLRLPRRAARFVVASFAEVDLLARLGVCRERCDVVPWQLSAAARSNRASHDVPASATSVLTTSDPGGAGVADMIRALKMLPELRLTVAIDDLGAADLETTDRWVRLASGLKVGARLRLLRVRTGESLRVLVRTSDLVVTMPHEHLDAGLVTTAMWAGAPLVVSDVPGARELVESGTTGLVLPPGKPRRLAQALRVVTRDAPARSAWTWAGERRAVETLDRHGTALTMSLALESLRGDRRREPAWAGEALALDGVAG